MNVYGENFEEVQVFENNIFSEHTNVLEPDIFNYFLTFTFSTLFPNLIAQ